MASVRFICGTDSLHLALERRIADFFEADDAILYTSCWNANEALFATILDEEDAVFSDELNHASIIDGIRLCKAKRQRYPHADLDALAALLAKDDSRHRVVVTDGVFSMEGELADVPGLLEVCEKDGALLVVDDSHATGVLGARGRGTAEEQGVHGRVPVTTGTLGKALGGAAGGFVAGPRPVVETLRQRSRPYLFSNALPPMIVAASLAAFDLLDEEPARVARLRGEHALVPAGASRQGIRRARGDPPRGAGHRRRYGAGDPCCPTSCSNAASTCRASGSPSSRRGKRGSGARYRPPTRAKSWRARWRPSRRSARRRG